MTINGSRVPRETLEMIADTIEELGFDESNNWLERVELNDMFIEGQDEEWAFEAARELGGEVEDQLESALE